MDQSGLKIEKKRTLTEVAPGSFLSIFRGLLQTLILSFFLFACEKYNALDILSVPIKGKTILIYAISDNSLKTFSDSVFNMVSDINLSTLHENLLLYLDDGKQCNLYVITENNQLRRIKSYGVRNSVNEDNVRELLQFVRKNYPAKENGLVLWSHGTGWLPSGKNTRSFGDDKGDVMDIYMLAKCIGNFKYSYIIFDACNMACIEVAWEMREKTKYIVASPTEVPAMGIVDDGSVIQMLLSEGELQGRLDSICNAYVDSNKKFLVGKSISVIDTDSLILVASTLKKQGRFSMDIDTNKILCYDFRGQKIFFDAQDFFDSIGCGALFHKCVTCYNYDKRNSYQWSGLSVFVPYSGNVPYQDSYSLLSWNVAVGWLDLFGY